MTVLLTGATSGIGHQVLKMLVAQQTLVYAIGRDFSKIEKLLAEYNSLIVPIEFDLMNVEDISSIFTNISHNNIRFDGLVHCAGIEETLPLRGYTPHKVMRVFNVNLFAGIELLRHFTKKGLANDQSSIIFLASVMSELGQSGKIVYSASKSALLGVVKSAALEFSARKIRVNAVSPGLVNTPMGENLLAMVGEANAKEIINKHPLGIGDSSDIASLVLYLLSSKSQWITGQNFIIDGGYSIQ